jgi:acetyl esterase/lipase
MVSVKKIFKRISIAILVILLVILVLLFIPRIWSALNPGKPPVGYHFATPTYLALYLGIEQMIDRNPEVTAEIEEIKDVEYKNVNGKSLQMDFYRLKSLDKPAPLLLFIHGGGWKGGKRSDYLIYLLDFARRGYVTATVSYRLIKDKTYPACVEDVSDAIRWLYRNGENYGYDPDRIAVIGGSAGAHLAMLTGYGWQDLHYPSTDTLPQPGHNIKAVVNIYGPTDLTTEYARNHSLVTNFIARSFEDAPELYREASPVNYLDENDPPTLILHGTSDDLVPVSQGDLLKSKLDSLGVACTYYRLPLWPHTMDLAKRVNEYSKSKMDDFFRQHLQ